MFKTSATFSTDVENVINDNSRKSHAMYDFLTWVLINSDRVESEEVVQPDRIRPDAVIRVWKTQEDVDRYISDFTKIFGDVATVTVVSK